MASPSGHVLVGICAVVVELELNLGMPSQIDWHSALWLVTVVLG